jgi:hypothetical protein
MASEPSHVEVQLCRHRLNMAGYHKMGEAGLFAPGPRVAPLEGEVCRNGARRTQ